MPLEACIYVDHRDPRIKDEKTERAAADARLIVRAVNCHAELVEACESALNLLRDLACHDSHIEQLSAALAKARGDDDAG